MAKNRNYRYKKNDIDGELPKKGFLYMEEGDPSVAVFERFLKEREVARYNLVDLNTDVKKLTKLRCAAGIRQSDLAEMTGISIKTIQGWEFRGMASTNLMNSIKIADALGVRDLRKLLDEYEET